MASQRVHKPQRLSGEVAVVTGAARNIGAAVAERLAADGAAVCINHHAASSATDAVAVVRRIEQAGGRAVAVEADVGEADAIHAMIETVVRELGAPTILVNNAAASVAGSTPWDELPVAAWDSVLHTNVTGAFLCARALVPSMRRQGHGRIISMGSVRSLLGLAGNAHYTATKSALEGMGRVLARELGQDGITVNTIIVGAIRTAAEAVYGDPADLDRRLLELQAIKRRGEPADVAGVVAFLASDDASFITGQSVTVDGGWVMH